MKKVLILALSALAALAGCQRQELAVTANGDEAANATREVTTQFVLNVTAAPQTKMTADVVQQNQNFRGIQDAKIYTYKTGMTTVPSVLQTAAVPQKQFELGLFFAEGKLDNSNDGTNYANNEESSKRVLQLSLPVGVDAVMFYGKAIKAEGVADKDYGATIATVSGTPSGTTFAAKKILGDNATVTKYDQTAALMIAVINHLLSTSVPEDGTITVGTGATAVTYNDLPFLSWAQLGHQYEIDKYPSATRYANTEANINNNVILGYTVEGLEEILGKCYYLFTYIQKAENPYDPVTQEDEWKEYYADNTELRPHGEYRAGSSYAMQSMVVDMYKVIKAASEADPTTAKEANAKRLAQVILSRAQKYFDIANGSYLTVSEIKSEMVDESHIVSQSEWNSKYAQAMNLNGYPYADFGIPEGAAQLGFHVYGTTRPEAEGGGTYPSDQLFYYHPNNPLVNPAMPTFEPRKYIYPAELWYYANSSIRTTNSDVTVDDYPNGVTPWSTEGSWTGWTHPGKVESSTRAVAVTNSINYGVALLKSSVVFASGVTQLEDNRSVMTGGAESNKTINVSTSNFQLRGILIGGVNPRMNWQFTRKYTATGNHEGLGDLSLFDGVIYDHSMASTAVPSTAANYTLVYDNFDSSASPLADQNDVCVALEFINGGEAFWGRDNLIPAGGVFYLAAKLPKPTAAQIALLADKWPTDHQIPPVKGVDATPEQLAALGAEAGKSEKIARVFIQDFMTTATFKIGATSLQKAFYSMPDLRASQMSLGLSVDLQWTPGLEYSIDL